MHAEYVGRYRHYRNQGVPSSTAYHWARTPEVPDLFDGEDFASWEKNGFVLDARLAVDDLHDLSHLGSFSHRWEEGALAVDLRSHDSGWFIPAMTEGHQYASLRAMKFGRAEARRLARRYVREDHKRFAEFGDRWWMVRCTVRASREDVELGSAALWGIESDSDPSFFTETALELADEAIAEARIKLERLRA